MSDKTPFEDEPRPAWDSSEFDDPQAAESASAPSGDEPQLEDDAASGELVDARFHAVQIERDELEAKLLRNAADYQNYVRRSHQNLEATRQETLMKLSRALVPVLDNFDRALELKPGAVSAEDVQKGVQSIRSALLKALEGFGLQKMEVQVGQEFDPHLHEALMRQPAEGIAANHIAMILMPGYTLNDQPVRPTQVSVAE